MGAELWRVAKGVGTLGMLGYARDRAVAEARQAEVHGARLAEHTVAGVWCGEWCVVWCVVCGVWWVVCGVWCDVSGLWFVVCGL